MWFWVLVRLPKQDGLKGLQNQVGNVITSGIIISVLECFNDCYVKSAILSNGCRYGTEVKPGGAYKPIREKQCLDEEWNPCRAQTTGKVVALQAGRNRHSMSTRMSYALFARHSQYSCKGAFAVATTIQVLGALRRVHVTCRICLSPIG